MAKVVSIQVGLPRTMNAAQDQFPSGSTGSWHSGIVKESVANRIWLGRLNLAGDGQADLKHHGGPDKAVLGYAGIHYSAWHAELEVEMRHGSFGENFTIDGMTEETVCIGDSYAIGDAAVEVSQPRQPCWKLARRWNVPDLDRMARSSGRTGWYFRVLREGWVGAGDMLQLLDRPCPGWTVSKTAEIWYNKESDLTLVEQLASNRYLSEEWRNVLGGRLQDTPEGRV